MFYKEKKVLVLQGHKMFGQCLIRKLLNQGAWVRASSEEPRKIQIEDKRLEVAECDLANPQSAEPLFKDIDIVFMTANKSAGAKVITEDPDSLLMYNISVQPRLLHMAVKANVQRVGFISSSYIYPDTGSPNVEEEGFTGDPWIPTNYGIGLTYRYLETLCKHFHMTTKTKFALIRPTAYYGPYDNFNPEEGHVIPSLIIKAVNRMNPYEVWGNGRDVRCFTYVEDLMGGFMQAVEKYPEADALNICPGKSHTIKDVVGAILKALDFQIGRASCRERV